MAVNVLSVLRVSQCNFRSLLRYMSYLIYSSNILHTICVTDRLTLAYTCLIVDTEGTITHIILLSPTPFFFVAFSFILVISRDIVIVSIST